MRILLIGLVVAYLLLLLAAIALQKFRQFLRENAPVISAISFPIILLGGTAAYYQIQEFLVRPDVKPAFRNPRALSMVIGNVSEKTARDPKYSVVLWNLDAASEDRANPLPIPVKTSNYIQPGRSWGPYSLFAIPGVQGRLKLGDRVFGWATVFCLDCAQTRDYWLYVRYGLDGWYAEQKYDDPVGFTIIRKILKSQDPTQLIFSLVPEDRRIQIE